MEEKIPLARFKAECFKILEKVQKTHSKIIITKRRIPIAKLVAIEEEREAYGLLKGTIHFKGNIIHLIEEEWNANT